MIPVKNIYYMLSYAFQVLNEKGYKDMATEEFHNVADLCAAILIKGVSVQINRGLGREYIDKTDTLSSLRGKIDVSESIKTMTMIRNQMVCSFDEFSVNTKMNQIIKATMKLLFRSDITLERKKDIRRLITFFQDVDDISIHHIDWNFRYDRNNQTYRMLISICYLVVKGLLQTNSDGCTKMMDFFDEQRMCRLYEKFILEYYRAEHKELNANPSQINWQVDDDFREMLPMMKTDIMLNKGNKYLIIDAKYYSHVLQYQFDKYSIHSANLYQIFTYVKNKEAELSSVPHIVSGMLLYAKTEEYVQPDKTYQMSGNQIRVATLDLNCDFELIKEQLDTIASDFLN